MLRRATETRFVAGQSLHGEVQKLLYEAVKVKPELCWRPQDVEVAKVMDLYQGELQHSMEPVPQRDVLQPAKGRGRASGL